MNERFSAVFERPVNVYPVATGTGANSIALAALSNDAFGAIYCHETAHQRLRVGAPEFFTGAKLVGLPGSDYKLDVATLDEALVLADRDNPTRVQPFASTSPSRATSARSMPGRGRRALFRRAPSRLRVHMDGRGSPRCGRGGWAVRRRTHRAAASTCCRSAR
jgi:threonine aldolase